LQLVTEFLQAFGVRIPKFVEHCRNLSGRGRRGELITSNGNLKRLAEEGEPASHAASSLKQSLRVASSIVGGRAAGR
jgi:hypothetical protein